MSFRIIQISSSGNKYIPPWTSVTPAADPTDKNPPGDSLLIVRQLEQYHPPNYARLRDLHKQARGLTDQLDVARWHHHLRVYNKMADAAANVAMDGRHSIQSFHPTPRPDWAGIELLLQGEQRSLKSPLAYRHIDPCRVE
jgi:hypothetical protein